MSKQTKVVTIDGMSCQHCVTAVENALSGTEGVQVDNVSIGKAIVTYEAENGARERMEQAIQDAGFSVRAMDAPAEST